MSKLKVSLLSFAFAKLRLKGEDYMQNLNWNNTYLSMDNVSYVYGLTFSSENIYATSSLINI